MQILSASFILQSSSSEDEMILALGLSRSLHSVNGKCRFYLLDSFCRSSTSDNEMMQILSASIRFEQVFTFSKSIENADFICQLCSEGIQLLRMQILSVNFWFEKVFNFLKSMENADFICQLYSVGLQVLRMQILSASFRFDQVFTLCQWKMKILSTTFVLKVFNF